MTDFTKLKINSNSDQDLSTSNTDVELELDIDDIIRRLTREAHLYDDRYPLQGREVKALTLVAQEVISREPIILSLSAPIKICGDIHGQFLDLIRLFKLCGYPPKTRYLFLGDYVDRGRRGIEVISLLFALKIKYPNDIFLLRGNHESELITKVYGFRQEIYERYNSGNLWKTFIKTFAWFPIVALIENSIFCCHGGLSPNMMKDSVKNIFSLFIDLKRPLEVPKLGLICDILWSDPMDQNSNGANPKGWKKNDRGCSWQFGFDIVEAFLEKYNLDLIVRAHQVVEDGYEFYCNRKLVTVFSAPHYGGDFDNAGSIFCLEKDLNQQTGEFSILEAGFIILKPDYTLPNQWFKNLDLKKRNIKKN